MVTDELRNETSELIEGEIQKLFYELEAFTPDSDEYNNRIKLIGNLLKSRNDDMKVIAEYNSKERESNLKEEELEFKREELEFKKSQSEIDAELKIRDMDIREREIEAKQEMANEENDIKRDEIKQRREDALQRSAEVKAKYKQDLIGALIGAGAGLLTTGATLVFYNRQYANGWDFEKNGCLTSRTFGSVQQHCNKHLK